ncbi:DUF1769-domain-containing protein [Pseudovirgaria hyperparasitica]|uniref:DUF1769-domain-containing protein n=1 Tax=Pseudovirgaria hyperparasitica TaxID=470096 RepID=A0A6A6VSI1_9PEZI|nr:DUF1769-domain-containing protein [Pseudovirgaria hyperparasitica]KAF2753552.1 DUF1769-domain-containing protein [Pseudovirgaria hyperparasitica]
MDLSTTDIVWGNDFDHPVRDRLPPGFNTAFRIVKEFIDPGLSCDAYADKPWLYGPALSCWFRFRIGEVQHTLNESPFPCADESHPLEEGADGTGTDTRSAAGMPEDSEKRRKFFLDARNRDKLTFEKDRVYQGDFFNPYLDFSKFALRLPGFSLGVLRYIDDKSHTLRYTCKNNKTGDVYFVVIFKLLFGEELRRALESDRVPSHVEDCGTRGHEDNQEDSQDHNQEEHDSRYQCVQEGTTRTSVQDTSHDEIKEALEKTCTSDYTEQKTSIFDI